jgi:hypothetical protein
MGQNFSGWLYDRRSGQPTMKDAQKQKADTFLMPKAHPSPNNGFPFV